MSARGRHAQRTDTAAAAAVGSTAALAQAADRARAEREALRDQARELHEAAQRAEAAARDLRGARDLVEKIAEHKIVAIITPICAEVVDGVNEVAKAGNDRVQFQVAHIETVVNAAQDTVSGMLKDVESRLMGFRDFTEARDRIAAEIKVSMADLVKDSEIMREIAELVAENLRTSTLKLVPNPGPGEFRVDLGYSNA